MAENALQTAREEFTKILDENEEGFNFVIELSEPPEEMDAEEWPNDAYSLIDATLDVVMQQEAPLQAVAIIVGADKETDAKVVQGDLTMGGSDHMYTIGDTGFDDAGDLDALAITGMGEGDEDDFAQYM